MKNNRLLTTACNPRGPRELAAVQTPPRHPQRFQRAAVRWFNTGKVILVLTGVLVAFVWLSPALHAGVIFTAGTGNDTVAPNGSLTIPITVSGFANLEGAQFSLTWNAAVLSYQSVVGENSALSSGFFNQFTTPTSDTLTWSWASVTPTSVSPDGSALFSVVFTASDNPGAITYVNFTNSPITIAVYDANDQSVSFSLNNDKVTVVAVPEPINWALGLFGCVFIGRATVRWISRRRTSAQSL